MGKFDSTAYRALAACVYAMCMRDKIDGFGLMPGINISCDWVLFFRRLMQSNTRFDTMRDLNTHIVQGMFRNNPCHLAQRVFMYIDCPARSDNAVERVPAKEWLRRIRYGLDKHVPIDIRGLTLDSPATVWNRATNDTISLTDCFKSSDARLLLFGLWCECFLEVAPYMADDIPTGTEIVFVGWTNLEHPDDSTYAVPRLLEGMRTIVFLEWDDEPDRDAHDLAARPPRRTVIRDYTMDEAASMYGGRFFRMCEEADYLIVGDHIPYLQQGIPCIIGSYDGDQTVQGCCLLWRESAVAASLRDIAPLYINRDPYGAYLLADVYERICEYMLDYCCPRPPPSVLSPYAFSPHERGLRVGADSYIGLIGNLDVQRVCRKLGWWAHPFVTWTFLEFLAFGSDHVVPFYETQRTLKVLAKKAELAQQRASGIITEAEEEAQLQAFKSQFNVGHYSRMFPFPAKHLFAEARADSRSPYGLVYCPLLTRDTYQLQVPFVVDVQACLALIRRCTRYNNISEDYNQKFGHMGEREYLVYIHQAAFCLGWYLNMVIMTKPTVYTLPNCCARDPATGKSLYGWREVPNPQEPNKPYIEVDYDLDASRPLVCCMETLDIELNERIRLRAFSHLHGLRGIDPRFFVGTRYEMRAVGLAQPSSMSQTSRVALAPPSTDSETESDESEERRKRARKTYEEAETMKKNIADVVDPLS